MLTLFIASTSLKTTSSKFNRTLQNFKMFFLNSKVGIASSLRRERERLHLKQSEMADQLGVSRSTQICYEKGSTEPTTGYLRSAQSIGADVFSILYGDDVGSGSVDWSRLQQCAEAVEFFCLRFAPSCPTTYRWKMIRELYQALPKSNEIEEPLSLTENLALDTLKKIWASYGK